MHLQEIQYLTFDLDLGVEVTRKVAKYPLHYVIYLATKFEIHTSNGLGGRSHGRTDRQADRRTDRRMKNGRRTDFGTKLIYPLF